jgi:hypothetical protein
MANLEKKNKHKQENIIFFSTIGKGNVGNVGNEAFSFL